LIGSKWFPWRFIIRRFAGAHGFIDPIALLSHLHRFGQPSEVAEPIELLRAGAILHARGLINSRVIQHNLDWVWPYWVERQFDPHDDAFIPRAFSITHINLTHRNWTAVGLPDCDDLPIVDPSGLVTPLHDGWSLDGWIIADKDGVLLPSRAPGATQAIDYEEGLSVVTQVEGNGLGLESRADVLPGPQVPRCRVAFDFKSDGDAWAVLALRPYNPEGVSLIHRVALVSNGRGWLIDGDALVAFSEPADRHHVSNYRSGDVYIHLRDREDQSDGECDVGMVTAAALFRLQANEPRQIVAEVPLTEAPLQPGNAADLWRSSLSCHCRVQVPDQTYTDLYDTALRTLVLHTPGEVYPGPYTYKRFWFRDAAFILHGLLCAGLSDRVEQALDRFPQRQTLAGYFHSQDGEWDSNGEALWILRRFCELTGREPKDDWRRAIRRGAEWISRKRVAGDPESLHAGLLPAGFSAEHLGPNDHYYWDDFWGVAGLRAAAYLERLLGETAVADAFERDATDFERAIARSLGRVAEHLGQTAMPASPYRRLDAGAIGSLAAGYPLRIFGADDARLISTVDFLLRTSVIEGGFFHDVVHSGINPYLTLHIAQVLLRAGDPRSRDLMDRIAALATPTGQWPEAIHPRTGGGCMGDGQHVWAAAEWVLMVRNCFVREEDDRLILASGVRPAWLRGPEALSFGTTPTPWGPISLMVEPSGRKVSVSWVAAWRQSQPTIEVRLPGHVPVIAEPGQTSIELTCEPAACVSS
jgi:hypothetical protein